jgi:hypothetical protein
LKPIRHVTLLPAEKPGMRVGLVDCGLPLCHATWTHSQFSWEIDARVKSRATALPECPRPGVSYESVAKSPAKLLKSQPVDLLVVDHSLHSRAKDFFNLELRNERVWTQWLDHSTPARVVEMQLPVNSRYCIAPFPGSCLAGSRCPNCCGPGRKVAPEEARLTRVSQPTSDCSSHGSWRISAALEDDRHPHPDELGSTLQGYERRVGTQPYLTPTEAHV